jgi:hypothetical protein
MAVVWQRPRIGWRALHVRLPKTDVHWPCRRYLLLDAHVGYFTLRAVSFVDLVHHRDGAGATGDHLDRVGDVAVEQRSEPRVVDLQLRAEGLYLAGVTEFRDRGRSIDHSVAIDRPSGPQELWMDGCFNVAAGAGTTDANRDRAARVSVTAVRFGQDAMVVALPGSW